jgi:glycosyltransferase involved in cell wall biosynthesis
VRRILWVTPIAPCFDAGGGGEIRQAHLLEALTERFQVDLLLTGQLADERIRSRMASVREIDVPAHVNPRSQLRRRVRDIRWQIVERQPDEVARHRDTRRALARAIAEGPRADIVCVEYVSLAGLLPQQRPQPWTLTLHNLTSEMARHNAALAPGRRQRAMLALEESNSRRIEHWAVDAYDLVVSPSPQDAALLGPDVAVVPNGVDLARFAPSPVPAEPRLVFTGALHTLPNREGIRWFCESVWPLILARIPDVRLDIVGSHPPAEVLALRDLPGVAVHPDVPDVVPFLVQARVAIVPLRIGSGSRLKVLEAMAAARPVLGTTIGVGGLEAGAERALLVADDPGQLAQAAVSVLRDQELAAGLAARGRALVEEGYAWEKIGQRYAERLEQL